MQKNKTEKLSLMAISLGINVLGAYIATATKVPLLLDHIGTIFICQIFGPKEGMITALISTMLQGMTFDWYSIPFAPTGILMAFLMGSAIKKNIMARFPPYLVIAVIMVPVSLLGGYISGVLFDGVTSSSSTIIIRFLVSMGMGTIQASFITQYIMEYIDRLFSYYLTRRVARQLND